MAEHTLEGGVQAEAKAPGAVLLEAEVNRRQLLAALTGLPTVLCLAKAEGPISALARKRFSTRPCWHEDDYVAWREKSVSLTKVIAEGWKFRYDLGPSTVLVDPQGICWVVVGKISDRDALSLREIGSESREGRLGWSWT